MPEENKKMEIAEKPEIAEKIEENTRSLNSAPLLRNEGTESKEIEKEGKIEDKKESKANNKETKIEKSPKKAQKSKKIEIAEENESKPKKQEDQKGIIHIYSSGNNTILHVTDITGAETISRVSGGMVTKADRLKSAPFQGMLAAQRVVKETLEKGITEVDIRIRAPGGHKSPSVGKGSQSAIKTISRSNLKINIIEDSTPVIHGYMRKKGGRRGRRL